MDKENKKATVYAYVGNDRGVARDANGKKLRNEWVKLNLELDINECIEKLSWRTSEDSVNESGGWGSNTLIIKNEDLKNIVGQLLTFCDAMQGDKEQRDAWKKLIRSTIYKWYDDKMYRYMLDN